MCFLNGMCDVVIKNELRTFQIQNKIPQIDIEIKLAKVVKKFKETKKMFTKKSAG